jgi:hypothetical protein
MLRSETGQTRVSFAAGSDGLKLSTDNRVSDVYLSASAANRAIYNDVGVANLGQMELRNVATKGRVQLLARGKSRCPYTRKERRRSDRSPGNTGTDRCRPHAACSPI